MSAPTHREFLHAHIDTMNDAIRQLDDLFHVVDEPTLKVGAQSLSGLQERVASLADLWALKSRGLNGITGECEVCHALVDSRGWCDRCLQDQENAARSWRG